ncbi:MAG: DUF4868 domain-containing protein [Bacteroidota bacterium]|nr:DUF4868 domain-containing protein [Bacteroidota bacterium]MDP3145693.1 DUF4868 domain-containing protein [Bacteroidota bacterium]
MAHKQKLKALKSIDLSNAKLSLAVVKEYKKDRVSQYDVKFVKIESKLVKRLRGIVLAKINKSNTVENYTFDCPEPEEDHVKSINYSETDFHSILTKIEELNPETDTIEDVEELIKAKAYVIILRIKGEIQVVAFKNIPENWKMKNSKGLIPLLFNDGQFEDLEQDKVFSISSTVDIIYYDEVLFILSKKDFEKGLNFREGMIAGAEEMYKQADELNLFIGIDILKEKVGNNQRYLRKIATIKNLGHYKDPLFLKRLEEICILKNWKITFDNGQIVITEETLDDILTLLQNKRLHSELTEQDFDVESVKPV